MHQDHHVSQVWWSSVEAFSRVRAERYTYRQTAGIVGVDSKAVVNGYTYDSTSIRFDACSIPIQRDSTTVRLRFDRRFTSNRVEWETNGVESKSNRSALVVTSSLHSFINDVVWRASARTLVTSLTLEACVSSWTHCVWSPCTARCSAVRPRRVRDVNDAFSFNSCAVVATWPLRAAQCSAVRPSCIDQSRRCI